MPSGAWRPRILAAAAAGAIAAALPASLPARAQAPAWPTFVDATRQLGIDFRHQASPTPEKYLLETMGSGVALLDANGDGRLDIYFVNGARLAPGMSAGDVPPRPDASYLNRLYLQRENGTFEDVTASAGVGGAGYGMGVATGDYDNDGDTDLFVTAYPSNTLYRNDGGGRFTDVTEAAGVRGSGWSTSAAFVDANEDGRLDLFVVRYLEWTFGTNPWCGERQASLRAYCHPDLFKPATPLFYLNEGGGRFREAAAAAGLASPHGKSLGVAIADYDRDGHVDLFVANDSVRQFLYRNRGDGTFEDHAMFAGAAVDEDGRVYAGMGVDFADFDNDGYPDVIVTNLSNQMYAVYRNGGDGTFTYATHRTGVGKMTVLHSGWGVRFVDLDRDGWKDLFIAQGHVLDTIAATSPHISYEQPPLAARNVNGRQFADMSAQSGAPFAGRWAARGLASGDLDNDGDVDIVVTTTNGPAYVLRNESAAGAAWLSISLEGRASNRDGIGALVHVVGASGQEQWWTVTTTASYLSASDRRVHVGLGADRAARLVEVRWPSGAVSRLEQVEANRAITIREADARPR